MQDIFSRTRLILGNAAMARLSSAKVAIFGIGGVGGHTAEALARSGVGRLDLFDNDTICPTNLNRQIYALHSTIGQYKVDAARSRILDINPAAVVNTSKIFYLPESADEVDLSQYDYVVDAIDTVSGKIEIAVRCHESGTRWIASMGAGNKVDASAFMVADIFDTSVCPLAKVMRHELRKRGIPAGKVVYSREIPRVPEKSEEVTHRRSLPGSNAFVPAVAGLLIAGEIVRDLSES